MWDSTTGTSPDDEACIAGTLVANEAASATGSCNDAESDVCDWDGFVGGSTTGGPVARVRVCEAETVCCSDDGITVGRSELWSWSW